MTSLTTARITAVLVGAGTFGFLFPTGSWRLDNIFLIPDLALCAVLLVAAALPGRVAGPALLAAFCFAAGVLVTAVAWYVVDGRIGVGALAGAVASVVMAAVLLRSRPWPSGAS
jgi:hypothetical protein